MTKNAAKEEIRFPFSSNGKLWNYHAIKDDNLISNGIIEKTAEEAKFDGSLTFEGITRQGNHSVLAWFRVSVAPIGKNMLLSKIHVFLSDLSEMIPKMKNGRITGTFVPTKRGTDYAWKLQNEKK